MFFGCTHAPVNPAEAGRHLLLMRGSNFRQTKRARALRFLPLQRNRSTIRLPDRRGSNPVLNTKPQLNRELQSRGDANPLLLEFPSKRKRLHMNRCRFLRTTVKKFGRRRSSVRRCAVIAD
jgi:hypothetical protein